MGEEEEQSAGCPAGNKSAELDTERFARRLREVLEERGLTRSAFIEKYYLNKSTASRYFTGKRVCQQHFVAQIFAFCEEEEKPLSDEERVEAWQLWETAVANSKTPSPLVQHYLNEAESLRRERDELKDQLEGADGSSQEVRQALTAMEEHVAALANGVNEARREITEDRRDRDALGRELAERDQTLAEELQRQGQRLADLVDREDAALAEIQIGMRALDQEVRDLRSEVPATGTELVPAGELRSVPVAHAEIVLTRKDRRGPTAAQVARLVPTYDGVVLTLKACAVILPSWLFAWAIGFLAHTVGTSNTSARVLLGWVTGVVGMAGGGYGTGLLVAGLMPYRPKDREAAILISSAIGSCASGLTYPFFGVEGAAIAFVSGVIPVGLLLLMNWADDHRA
ncbi:hypothetical protein BX281_0032 [Streptomyces sp. Ag82_O1-15]|uniref:hypothetical protein n=1 Tax=Streptomyces sp. Ag82_O1-15 TaxID=1938855 RepID=UPI000BB0DF9C|nr:hypothetical protein [Streptomyces sp. Ag82_O1-15]PBC92384.1 hypothetical protein BX281_0032 [Streptomyces sp. Ag82_O1-15]